MSLYKELELDDSASADEIKKSFRKLSMKYHPDRGSGNEEKYKKINQAYNILGDPQKKHQYDNESKMSNMFGGGGHEDIFNMMFNGMPFSMGGGVGGNMPNVRIFQNGRPMFMKPQPIKMQMNISMIDSYKGIKKNIKINRQTPTGSDSENIYVDIPKGIDNNEVIVLKEKGNIMNNMKGDVQLRIRIINNTKFERKGMNLYFKKTITFKESLCGFSFVMEFIDGKKFNVNNNDGKIIYNGFKKTIPNLGIVRDNSKGDLIIIFDVEYPDKLTSDIVEKLNAIL